MDPWGAAIRMGRSRRVIDSSGSHRPPCKAIPMLPRRPQDLLAASATAQSDKLASPAPSVSYRPKARPLPPVRGPSAAERVALFKADFVSRPQTDAARQYIKVGEGGGEAQCLVLPRMDAGGEFIKGGGGELRSSGLEL